MHREIVVPRSVLMSVESPGRYVGGEINQIIREDIVRELREKGGCSAVRTAFCFPDVYEIGMSNLALQILYKVLNSEEWTSCERAFAPWPDMDKLMREKDIPLYSMETRSPLYEFDVVAFTLGYEMCFTNVLQMLDLGKIPFLSRDRKDDDPIVVCGGPVAYNIEPMADYFDAAFMGEGEEVDLEFTRLIKEYKDNGKKDRQALLRRIAKIEGMYVPSLYEPQYENGRFKRFIRKYDDVPEKIRKRIITDLDNVIFPTAPVVPNNSVVHDRAYLEIFRGCIRGCRFCQAGYITRPVREKSADVLIDQGRCIERSTGYDELGMLSLSTSDYTGLSKLTDGLLEAFEDRHTSLSLPSLRIDNFALELMDKVSRTRKTGLTFAPEAGTQRLRDVINKGICEDDIMSALKLAFDGGWSTVKLYFMLGLPTETDEDVEGIADLALKIEDLYYQCARERGEKPRRPEITVSTSMFIPKPFTAFQWEGQNTAEDFLRKQALLKSKVKKSRNIRYIWHDVETSCFEGILARGDRRLCPAMLDGYKAGMIFDAWDDNFDYEKWMQILDKHGITWEMFAGAIDPSEELPWDHIDVGVTRSFFLKERENAYKETVTPNCREKCAGCGAACFKTGVCFEKR
ncbi:MAG: TIGR03960 family B12-binding radical SAM protein [Clostridiales bacterium]|nr:TIGR03960 family B12-binding radical SAM protein [Clostridiales bacterium]